MNRMNRMNIPTHGLSIPNTRVVPPTMRQLVSKQLVLRPPVNPAISTDRLNKLISLVHRG